MKYFILELNSEESKLLDQLSEALIQSEILKEVDPNRNPLPWETKAHEIVKSAGISLLNRFNTILKDFDVIYITNLSQKDTSFQLPYISGLITSKEIPYTVAKLFILLALLNKCAIAYRDENKGNILRAVMERKGSEGEISSQCYMHPTGWHMDCADRPFAWEKSSSNFAFSPNWLLFGILQGDDSTPMQILSVQDVLAKFEQIQDDKIRSKKVKSFWGRLNLKDFEIKRAESFETKNVLENAPIIRMGVNGIISRYNEITCIGKNQKAIEVLTDIKTAINDSETSTLKIKVKPGDLVVINNYSCIHFRDKYIPLFNNKDRFLVRIYAVDNESSVNTRIWT